MYRLLSALPFMNPSCCRYLSSLEYHALRSCFRPYKTSSIYTHNLCSLTIEILLVVQCGLLLQVPRSEKLISCPSDTLEYSWSMHRLKAIRLLPFCKLGKISLQSRFLQIVCILHIPI
jgi:hypothetical protein